MPIYTRTGDKGKTSLFSGKRVWKYDIRVEAYGSLDELNALLGVIASHLHDSKIPRKHYITDIITSIQTTLFYICSYLADLPDALDAINLKSQTTKFEKKIDEMTNQMPRLSNFILPGGGIVGAYLQHARTVARRAERQVMKLHQKEAINTDVISYVNRLSDLLFTLSRFANYKERKRETIWER